MLLQQREQLPREHAVPTECPGWQQPEPAVGDTAEGEASSAWPASLPLSGCRSYNFGSPPLVFCELVEDKEAAAAGWRPDGFAMTSRQLPSQIIATLGSHYHPDCFLLTT